MEFKTNASRRGRKKSHRRGRLALCSKGKKLRKKKIEGGCRNIANVENHILKSAPGEATGSLKPATVGREAYVGN